MFDESFVEEWVNRVAEALAKRIPVPKVAQRYMSFEQAGEYIGVSEESVRCYVNQNWLPVSVKGGKRWIDKEDVDRFMATNKRYVKVPGKAAARGGTEHAA
jgi:excisionase family DNA binding protein